jgi:pimeloyl-ACP methyl ester carboxylesterase
MHFVLIHGGAHGAWCWQPLLEHLDTPALAVDLPGRAGRPGDLETLAVRDFAAAVVEDIEKAALSRVVLVGHSMAGLTIPPVLERIPERIASVVFVSCVLPREGQSVLDAIQTPEAQRPRSPGDGLPEERAREMFCNDMDEAQTRFVLERLCPESVRVMNEPARTAGLRLPVPRCYVKLLRDQALAPAFQDESIRNAGPGCTVYELDTGHNVMISRPRELARILNRLT